MWLVLAYIVSAALEIIGIGLVVLDVRDDRTRSLTLTQKYLKVHSGTRIRSSSDTAFLHRDPTSAQAQKIIRDRVLENDRRLVALEANSERADELIQGVVLDMLSVKPMRRLRGPALVGLGIIVGTAANIAASG